MALIEWRDAYRTGIASVDHEHAELIVLLNLLHAELVRPDGGAVGRFLGELHDAIASHFALEEAVMRESGYPGFARHKADHERLLDEIRDLMEEQHAAVDADLAGNLTPRLERWFMNHFHEEDARLHDRERPTA
jgi:hemerythrin-like metal-binding protein